MRMKYIIGDLRGVETPIIFSEAINHNDMAANLWYEAKNIKENVFSAGFITIDSQNGLTCQSGSVSLQIDGNPEQSADDQHRILRKMGWNPLFDKLPLGGTRDT